MQPIMLARATLVQAFTDVMYRIGAPVEQELQRAGLPDMMGIEPNTYIPVLPVLKFIQRIEHKEGIADIGFLASRQEILARLSEDFTTMTKNVPTLYTRLRQFAELAPLENTYCRVSMVRVGNEVRICNNLVGHPGLDGLHYSEWIQIMAIIEIIRKTEEPGWQPSEITFQSWFSPCESAFEQFPETRFLFGQKDTSITMPIALISQSLHERNNNQSLCEALTTKQSLPAKVRLDFPGSLKLALLPYLRGGYPDINLAAEIANTSARTLQRRLAQFGLSYSNLVQQTRFEVAVEMLKDPGIKSLDIAFSLGYENPSNFARAFRHIAGISPQEYRRQQDN